MVLLLVEIGSIDTSLFLFLISGKLGDTGDLLIKILSLELNSGYLLCSIVAVGVL